MYFSDFRDAIAHATSALMSRGVEVDTGSWQGVSTEGHPDLVTIELMHMTLEVPVDRVHRGDEGTSGYYSLSYPDQLTPILADEIQPNLPWANDHFNERVSRVPSNPGVEYENWPWWQGQLGALEVGGKQFSHTYQERFWPPLTFGIRYQYGNLDDVVAQLEKNPYTRQATFPIFFPEDTGAVHGGRVPCTLHYHFLLRNGRLNMWYPIRSCDLVRHFRDDLYMACKLLLWVITELQERELRGDSPQLWVDIRPGVLFFNAYSFHVHKGDLHHVQI
jgi:hypothetical protein